MLAYNFNRTTLRLREYVQYIDEISPKLREIAGGNLAFTLEHDYTGEFEKIRDSLEEISRHLSGTIGQLNTASHEVASGAQQVSSGAVALSQGSAEQAASVQAIEEGFILDVLQNYTTYDTFYQINKEIEEDPRCKTVDAKRQIARFVELHETNIAQRVEGIVEHFRTTVMPELGGMAKAMVITASRQGAVKYRQAFEDYTKKKGYSDIKALVAFSGKVKLPDDETEYSEASMNGFPEDRLTKEFDKDEYQVLLVANKYQTGFDQPKLCAMYVLKKLKGVSAVQTLSRLNRICPPFEKKTFVLDFANTYEDIKAAFAPYYTITLLSTSVTPTAIYDLEAQIDAYTVLDPDDIEKANELLYKGNISSKDKQKLTFYFKRSKNMIEQYEPLKQQEIVSQMRHLVRFYEFLLQVSCFEDTDLHKKYNFITYLLAYINIKHPGGGYNLDGKIKATNFVQKKVEEHTDSKLVAQPVVKLPTAESFGLTEAKEERLSQIIANINSRTGKAYDNDVAVKAMLQIRDILLKSDKLKTSARNNTVKDFELSYFDDIDDALIEGLEQNQDFFSLLLSNDEISNGRYSVSLRMKSIKVRERHKGVVSWICKECGYQLSADEFEDDYVF